MEIKEMYRGAIEKLTGNIAYLQRLYAALGDNPSEWVYEGECIDAGAPIAFCSCGHPIRWMFYVTRGAEKRILGSSCIETYATLVPGMMERYQADMDKMVKMAQAVKAAAKLKAQVAENAILQEKWVQKEEAVKTAIKALRDKRVQNRWLNQEDYSLLWKLSKLLEPFKAYKRAGSYTKEYNRRLEGVDKLLKGAE